MVTCSALSNGCERQYSDELDGQTKAGKMEKDDEIFCFYENEGVKENTGNAMDPRNARIV